MANVPTVELATRYAYRDLPNGVDESCPLDFHSPYGCSKGAADQYVHDYARIYGLPTIVFRQSCIYGPRQMGVEDQGWVAWFVIALIMGRPITIFGDGKQARDLLYVDDLLRAFDLAIDRIETTRGQIYNMGGGPANTISVWWEFKRIAEEVLGRPVPDPAFVPLASVTSPSSWRTPRRRGATSAGHQPSRRRRESGDWLRGWKSTAHSSLDRGSMRILVCLTYYRPHVSGLTIYVERLSRALVERGHDVTILTSRFDPQALPPRMRRRRSHRPGADGDADQQGRHHADPGHLGVATRAPARHHQPSPAAVRRGRHRRSRAPPRRASDLDLPLRPTVAPGRVQPGGRLGGLRHKLRCRAVERSRRCLHSGLRRPLAAPTPVPRQTRGDPASGRDAVAGARGSRRLPASAWHHGAADIGFATRFATEKGIEYLVEAMPRLLERFPTLKVLFAGPYHDVIGEETYRQRLAPGIAALGEHWEFLGTLRPEELPLLRGARLPPGHQRQLDRVVRSRPGRGDALRNAGRRQRPPGVRQPVRTTGMGEIVPVGDPAALVEGITKVLEDRARYVRPRAEVERLYDLDVTVPPTKRLFAEELRKKAGKRCQR